MATSDIGKAAFLNVKNKDTGEIEKKTLIPLAPSDGDLGGISKEKLEQIDKLKEDLDNKIEHVGGYKEYDIGTPNVGTYWNKSTKKQLESETFQSFNPISLEAGTYHYENMSGLSRTAYLIGADVPI